MPTYLFEAMDATGNEIKSELDAPTEEEAQATIRGMGYFVTKISVKKSRKAEADKQAGKNCIMLLVNGNKPVMLKHKEADEFRDYLQSPEESSVNTPIKLRLVSRISA